jgi:hypothetical protein
VGLCSLHHSRLKYGVATVQQVSLTCLRVPCNLTTRFNHHCVAHADCDTKGALEDGRDLVPNGGYVIQGFLFAVETPDCSKEVS